MSRFTLAIFIAILIANLITIAFRADMIWHFTGAV
jgi:hypothetical protein